MSEAISSKADAPVIENPEKASTNFYWTYQTNAGVFNFQTTIRGILDMEQIKAHIKSASEAMAHIIQLGGQAKWSSKGSDPTDTSSLPGITTSATLQSTSDEVFNFDTEKLLVTNSSGKMYYKIVGKPFTKFGVTVWPEVLSQTGMKVDQLEAKEYNFPGYKAYYIKNAEGNPQKVIRLEKVA